MSYPTIEEVETADHETLARWYRFLPSPNKNEIEILNRIISRYNDKGSMTTELSKKIGF